jgi:hypothetical protein
MFDGAIHCWWEKRRLRRKHQLKTRFCAVLDVSWLLFSDKHDHRFLKTNSLARRCIWRYVPVFSQGWNCRILNQLVESSLLCEIDTTNGFLTLSSIRYALFQRLILRLTPVNFTVGNCHANHRRWKTALFFSSIVYQLSLVLVRFAFLSSARKGDQESRIT